MADRRRVIVVGGGVGGLAAAIRLRSLGHQVAVFERNDVVGGKLATYVRDGHTFDVGPSLVTLPHVFDEVTAVLERGEVIGVFPEGTRSLDGQLHRGHVGAAHLALTTGAPIVPVGIVGTDQVLPTGARLVRPFQQVTIALGEPITTDGPTRSTNRARRALTDRFMAEVARLCGEPYVDEYATLHLG